MLNYKLNAQGVFTPSAVAPPDVITPEQVLRDNRSAQGGQAHVPPSFVQAS